MTEAPTLLLMPGMDGTGELFEPLRAALPNDHATEVLSYPPDVVASYEELAELVRLRLPTSGEFVLVAESFSGPLALMLAATCPSGLRGLVLCASFVRSPLRGPTTAVLPVLAKPFARIEPPDWVVRRMLLGSDPPQGLLARVTTAVRSVQPDVLAQRLSSIAQVDVSALGERIAVPALYLRASRDRLVGKRSVARVLACLREIRVVDIDAPHLVLQCAPDESASAIRDFCSSLRS